MSEAKWYLRTQDETFGPETCERLVEWARTGRILPGQEVSDDEVTWRRVEDIPFLDMRFSIDIGDGNPRGPFNRAAAEAVLARGTLPPGSRLVETREPFTAPEPPAEPSVTPPAEPAVKVVEKEVRVEVPVERIVEKVVVDETRVHELEGLLDEERRHTADLQARLDESSRKAAAAVVAAAERENGLKAEASAAQARGRELEAAVRDAVDRENKYVEQVKSLEDELRRLPQAASEVAEIQAAVYAILKGEIGDFDAQLERERREFEESRRLHQARLDRLEERRRILLKRAGNNIEDMTRRALLERPEDPRTVQLRKELEDLRRTHEQAMLDRDERIRVLAEQLRLRRADEARAAESMRDVKQLRQEVEGLRERLQAREKELLAERQRNEEIGRQQATRQQALLARLEALESPSIGTSATMSTNQSREARQVRLAGWMSFRR